MADENSGPPEGTDKIIAGASAPDGGTGGTIGAAGSSDLGAAEIDVLIIEEVEGEDLGVAATGSAAFADGGASVGTGTAGADGGVSGGTIVEKLRSSTGKVSGQAAEKARGFVGQGLERSSEAIANASRLVGDTATGIDERLGQEFGDYARRAASTMESLANNLATKDPDELIGDTRDFVRRSPGIALAGAAVVGFALARLVKGGLAGVDVASITGRQPGNPSERDA
jgi:hypothetical protein